MDIECDINWKRFALQLAVEKWDMGFAWVIEFGPFCIQGTPPNNPNQHELKSGVAIEGQKPTK